MAIVTTTKGSKKHLTSSYFQDISVLRSSRADWNASKPKYWQKNEDEFDTDKLKRAYAIQEIILWRKGCIELSDYVSRLNESQLKDVTTKYMGEDYEEYTGEITRQMMGLED